MSHLDTLNSFYDAEQRYVAAGGAAADADFTEMAAFLHPEVVVRQGPTVPFPGNWCKIAAVERFFALFTETWSALRLENIQLFEGDTGVAVTMGMQATARNTGKLLDTQVGHFFIFEDGLIRQITVFYLDPVEVRNVTLP